MLTRSVFVVVHVEAYRSYSDTTQNQSAVGASDAAPPLWTWLTGKGLKQETVGARTKVSGRLNIVPIDIIVMMNVLL